MIDVLQAIGLMLAFVFGTALAAAIIVGVFAAISVGVKYVTTPEWRKRAADWFDRWVYPAFFIFLGVYALLVFFSLAYRVVS